jgi:AcrR family transcriptional regulator
MAEALPDPRQDADPRAGRRGRQPEARRNDRAVLDAAREVFAVHGPDASVAQVAAQAGVGMGSLYRRYPTKEALLQHLCQSSMDQQVAAAGRALARGRDPWEALAAFVTECVGFRAGVLSAVAGTIAVTEQMRATAGKAHDLLERLVRRARRAGALRRDAGSVDLHQLIELFSRRPPGDPIAYERLLAVALDGLRAPGFTPLPGPAPDWRAHAARWSDHRVIPTTGLLSGVPPTDPRKTELPKPKMPPSEATSQ